MASNRLIVDIPLAGASGTTHLIVPGRNTLLGYLWCMQLRLTASDYTFTAFELRATCYPKNLVEAGIAMDARGEPTATYSAFSAPDELVYHATGNLAPGAASATTRFYQNFPGASRRLAVGPLCLSIQWTSSSGAAGNVRVSQEFLNFDV